MALSIMCSRLVAMEWFIDSFPLMEGTVIPVKVRPLPNTRKGTSRGDPARLDRAEGEIVLGSIVPVRFNWSITFCASGPRTRLISDGMLNTVKLVGRSNPMARRLSVSISYSFTSIINSGLASIRLSSRLDAASTCSLGARTVMVLLPGWMLTSFISKMVRITLTRSFRSVWADELPT